MKQCITISQFNSLEENEQIEIAIVLEVATQKDKYIAYWINSKVIKELIVSKCTIGKLIETIRQHYQLDIYTIGGAWYVQLYDLNDCSKDQQSRIYENINTELVDVLFECVLWVLERINNS